MQSNKDVGSPAYIVSLKWLLAYQKFILSEQFDQNISEDKLEYDKETHFK
jgi:hypothetical protein